MMQHRKNIILWLMAIWMLCSIPSVHAVSPASQPSAWQTTVTLSNDIYPSYEFYSTSSITPIDVAPDDDDAELAIVSVTVVFVSAKMTSVGHTSVENVRFDVETVPPEEITRMIGLLPPGYRAVFNLFVFEQKSHKQIAAMLGIKENSSASQYLRAKSMLKKLINEYQQTRHDKARLDQKPEVETVRLSGTRT